MTIEFIRAYTKTGIIYHFDNFDIIGTYKVKKYDKYGYVCINKSTCEEEKDCKHWIHTLSEQVFTTFDKALDDAVTISTK